MRENQIVESMARSRQRAGLEPSACALCAPTPVPARQPRRGFSLKGKYGEHHSHGSNRMEDKA
jgi:hypothetical protein